VAAYPIKLKVPSSPRSIAGVLFKDCSNLKCCATLFKDCSHRDSCCFKCLFLNQTFKIPAEIRLPFHCTCRHEGKPRDRKIPQYRVKRTKLHTHTHTVGNNKTKQHTLTLGSIKQSNTHTHHLYAFLLYLEV
jgi:hypothetical protein